MIFVDWTSLSQSHRPGSLPVVGSEFRVSHSLETGELLRENVVGFQHEGSFDSSLHIRSDGSVVSVSGNPSGFDRPDNLFGWSSVASAVARINRELVSLGLPELNSQRAHEEMRLGSMVIFRSKPPAGASRSEIRSFRPHFDSDNGRQAAHTDSLLPDGRSRFSRVDLTQNIATNGAMDFLRHLSTYVHHGKAGNLYPNGRTVDWGNGSRRIYIKFYDKAYDLDQKIKKLQKRLHGKHRERILDHIEYLFKLKRWCEENGIVRLEVTFKATELIDRKLIYIEAWEGETMSNVIKPYQFHKKINLEETRFDGVSNHLLSMGLGVSERVARQAELIHTAWVNGSELMVLCGTLRNFNRYRKLLLNVGVDIKNPCDISRLTLRVHKSEYREISPPSWYSLPGNERPVLSLVA
jgi:hypothetical protein